MDKSSLYSAIATYSAGWNMGFHKHPHFEITVVIFGHGTFSTDNQSFPINKGDIVLIPPNIPHNYSSLTSIRFAVVQIESLPSELQSVFYQITQKDAPYLFPIAQYCLERYEALFNIWINMLAQPLKSSDRIIKVWIELFLLFIFECVEKLNEVGTVASVAEYIRNNYDKDIRISTLAKNVNMSENGFRACFKKTYGVSPKQYLQKCRMSEAKMLLHCSGKTVQEVALQVGFPNIHAFSSWFQTHTGMSPTEWRHSQQADEALRSRFL